MGNINDIFNLPADVREITKDVVKSKNTVDENLYSPSVNDAPDKVYKATIRFLPNFRDINVCTVSKYVYFLTDVNKENGFYVDDPTTIGEKSPINTMYWKLKNSKNAIDNQLAEQLSRNYFNYSLIQIVKDEQHPELEGKIKVFRYGVKIKNKIDDESDGDEPCNVFDLYSGKNFNLVVEIKSNYNNYDRSKFSNSVSPITIDGKKMGTSEADRRKIIEYLQDSPELEKYEFKEWDDETRERVYAHLRTYTGEVSEDDGNPVEKVRNQDAERKAARRPKASDPEDVIADIPEEEDSSDSKNDDFFNMEDIDL